MMLYFILFRCDSLLIEMIYVILILLKALEPRIYVLVVTPLPMLHCSILFVLLPRNSPLPDLNSLCKLLQTLHGKVFLILELPRGRKSVQYYLSQRVSHNVILKDRCTFLEMLRIKSSIGSTATCIICLAGVRSFL